MCAGDGLTGTEGPQPFPASMSLASGLDGGGEEEVRGGWGEEVRGLGVVMRT